MRLYSWYFFLKLLIQRPAAHISYDSIGSSRVKRVPQLSVPRSNVPSAGFHLFFSRLFVVLPNQNSIRANNCTQIADFFVISPRMNNYN